MATPTLSEQIRMRQRALSSFSYTVSMLAVASLHRRVAGAHGQSVFDGYVQRWADGILRRAGCELRLQHQGPKPSGRRSMIVANHRSSLDIPVLLRCFGGSLVSKAEVRDWPVIGVAADRAATIFVDRSDARSGVRAIRAMRSALQQDRSVSVFPEGTTHEGDEVREFAPGCFAALRGLAVDIIPVGITYPRGTEFIDDQFIDHARKLGRRRRTPIGVSIGEPLEPAGTPEATAEYCRAAVQSQVLRARGLTDRN